jgi:hypothetical protein
MVEMVREGKMCPRRNSLGDWKILARTSQTQVGLRRDFGWLARLAMNIESELLLSFFLRLFSEWCSTKNISIQILKNFLWQQWCRCNTPSGGFSLI